LPASCYRHSQPSRLPQAAARVIGMVRRCPLRSTSMLTVFPTGFIGNHARKRAIVLDGFSSANAAKNVVAAQSSARSSAAGSACASSRFGRDRETMGLDRPHGRADRRTMTDGGPAAKAAYAEWRCRTSALTARPVQDNRALPRMVADEPVGKKPSTSRCCARGSAAPCRSPCSGLWKTRRLRVSITRRRQSPALPNRR